MNRVKQTKNPTTSGSFWLVVVIFSQGKGGRDEEGKKMVSLPHSFSCAFWLEK